MAAARGAAQVAEQYVIAIAAQKRVFTLPANQEVVAVATAEIVVEAA